MLFTQWNEKSMYIYTPTTIDIYTHSLRSSDVDATKRLERFLKIYNEE